MLKEYIPVFFQVEQWRLLRAVGGRKVEGRSQMPQGGLEGLLCYLAATINSAPVDGYIVWNHLRELIGQPEYYVF